MPTVIDRQAEAYRQSVLEDRLDGNLPDAVDALQDLIGFGISIASRYVALVTGYRRLNRLSRETASWLAGKIHPMMGSMVEVQRLWGSSVFDGVDLLDKAEFNEAVLELRELIADLEDIAAGVAPAPPASEQERSAFRDEFRRLAQTHRPPQSWYDEDFTTLAGPGGV